MVKERQHKQGVVSIEKDDNQEQEITPTPVKPPRKRTASRTPPNDKSDKIYITENILEEHREIQEHITITTQNNFPIQSQPVIDALNETERNITNN